MFDTIVKTIVDLGFDEVIARAYAYTYKYRNGTRFEVYNGIPSFVDPETREEFSLEKRKIAGMYVTESVIRENGVVTFRSML